MPRDTVVLKRPASWEKDMWKDALPIGAGIMGGLILGAIEKEQIIITRHDLWHKRKNVMPLPDITESFLSMRKAMDEGNYHGGCHMMENALREKGYDKSADPVPFPLGSLKLNYITDGVTFRHYIRGIDMKKALSFVSWEDQRGKSERECFVSRNNGIMYFRIKTDFEATYEIDFDFYDNLDYGSQNEKNLRCEKLTKEVSDNGIFYAANTDGEDFGVLLKAFVKDGNIEKEKGKLRFVGKEIEIKLLSFAKKERYRAKSELSEELLCSDDFGKALSKHEKKHSELYERVSLSFTKDDDKTLDLTNRELLDIAYEEEASDALIEKLWRFGRYLFISAMHENANPFPLYGLWPGAYNLPWTAHVCNENVQCMYWHTLTGGLSQSIKNLIHYYYKKSPQ